MPSAPEPQRHQRERNWLALAPSTDIAALSRHYEIPIKPGHTASFSTMVFRAKTPLQNRGKSIDAPSHIKTLQSDGNGGGCFARHDRDAGTGPC